MDDVVRSQLERIYAEGRALDAAEPDRTRRRRNLEPDSAALLHLLVRTLRPASVLELGTSNGYSTIWLADTLPEGGRLVTVDNDEGRAAQARENFQHAGLAGRIDARVADAAEVLAAWPADDIDLLFLDAERPAYPGYWPDLQRVLSPGGLLVVDNCASHAEEVAPLRALVDAADGYESVLVPTGAGLLLVSAPR